ncbi:unnamed protein product, partial [Symbiodinium sp. KB8]
MDNTTRSVFYKFKNSVSYETLKFKGQFISLEQLKRNIISRHNLDQDDRRAVTSVIITDAETQQRQPINPGASLLVRLDASSSASSARAAPTSGSTTRAYQIGDTMLQPRQQRSQQEVFQPTKGRTAPFGYQISAPTSTTNFMSGDASALASLRQQAGARPNAAAKAAALPAAAAKKYDSAPAALKCAISGQLLLDAVLLPCCGKHVSDEAAREAIPANDLKCPLCGTAGLSVDNMVILKGVRDKAAAWLQREVEGGQPVQEEAAAPAQHAEVRRQAADDELAVNPSAFMVAKAVVVDSMAQGAQAGEGADTEEDSDDDLYDLRSDDDAQPQAEQNAASQPH